MYKCSNNSCKRKMSIRSHREKVDVFLSSLLFFGSFSLLFCFVFFPHYWLLIVLLQAGSSYMLREYSSKERKIEEILELKVGVVTQLGCKTGVARGLLNESKSYRRIYRKRAVKELFFNHKCVQVPL